ncbi:MAG: YggS family pyridoxal phosphate-dependent enzyme [Arenicellales bacterium WSBS_2016_MAG_OTU3]
MVVKIEPHIASHPFTIQPSQRPLPDSHSDLKSRYENVLAGIRNAEQEFHREPGTVRLLAVSKTWSARHVREVYELGQRTFGENYLHEAKEKQAELTDLDIEWHFIGVIQSNKCRDIAQHFDWVHSVDRLKIAHRLSELRPSHAAPLNVCLQVNVHNEATKAGMTPAELEHAVKEVAALPRLTLRGIMAIPKPESDFVKQCETFAEIAALQRKLLNFGIELDSLSMGMTQDMRAAIAQGATQVRIGTAIFGPRPPKQP